MSIEELFDTEALDVTSSKEYRRTFPVPYTVFPIRRVKVPSYALGLGM